WARRSATDAAFVPCPASGCPASGMRITIRSHLLRRRNAFELSAQHHGQLLAAALDGDAPQPALLVGGALEIAGAADLVVVDADHAVAALESEALRRRALGDIEDHHALRGRIQPHLVGERGR